MTNKLWAIKMLFIWRYKLGYWDFDAFKAAWSKPRGCTAKTDIKFPYIAEARYNEAIDYANESMMNCKCGNTNWTEGIITNRGSCSDTPYEPAMHWFQGWVECECGHREYFYDSG